MAGVLRFNETFFEPSRKKKFPVHFPAFNGYIMQNQLFLMKDTNISVRIVIAQPASWWLHYIGLLLN